MDRVLTIFMYAWVATILMLNVFGASYEFYRAGFFGGISYLQETYSPYNFINIIVEAVTLSPAIGAYHWRNLRRRRQRNSLLGMAGL
jgi:hypothetical protein